MRKGFVLLIVFLLVSTQAVFADIYWQRTSDDAVTMNLTDEGILWVLQNVTAQYYFGSGQFLTDINGSNILANSITGDQIQNGTIQGGDLAADITISTTGNITAANFFGNGSALTGVTATSIADNSVDSDTIVNESILGADIQNGTIQSGDLADGAVTNPKIAPNAVNTTQIIDGEVQTPDIADKNVTTAKLDDDAVTSAKIADGTVGNDDIAANAINTSQIIDNTVTNEDIDNTDDFTFNNLVVSGNLTVLGDRIQANVTDINTNGSISPEFNTTFDLGSSANWWANLYAETITGNTLNVGTLVGSLDWSNITNVPAILTSIADAGGINSTHIIDGSVTGADIAANTITNTNIDNSDDFLFNTVNTTGNLTVGEDLIVNGVIYGDGSGLTGVAGGPDSVNSSTILNGSIQSGDLADGAVTNPKIASNAVNTTQIIDGEVQTPDIADKNVTTAKLDNDAVTSIKIADDTVNNDDIDNTDDYLVNALNTTTDINVGNNIDVTNNISLSTVSTFRRDAGVLYIRY